MPLGCPVGLTLTRSKGGMRWKQCFRGPHQVYTKIITAIFSNNDIFGGLYTTACVKEFPILSSCLRRYMTCWGNCLEYHCQNNICMFFFFFLQQPQFSSIYIALSWSRTVSLSIHILLRQRTTQEGHETTDIIAHCFSSLVDGDQVRWAWVWLYGHSHVKHSSQGCRKSQGLHLLRQMNSSLAGVSGCRSYSLLVL